MFDWAGIVFGGIFHGAKVLIVRRKMAGEVFLQSKLEVVFDHKMMEENKRCKRSDSPWSMAIRRKLSNREFSQVCIRGICVRLRCFEGLGEEVGVSRLMVMVMMMVMVTTVVMNMVMMVMTMLGRWWQTIMKRWWRRLLRLQFSRVARSETAIFNCLHFRLNLRSGEKDAELFWPIQVRGRGNRYVYVQFSRLRMN